MVWQGTVEELLAIAPDKYEITVFGAEPYGNYNRIMLSSVLCGEKNIEDIIINDRQWYADNHITLYAGEGKAVVTIDRGIHLVYTQDGTQAQYDKLLIATGSNPVVAQIPGKNLQGVISFRQIIDVNKMLRYSREHKKAIVLGGGLLGLEAANGLAVRGMDVTVVHSNAILLNRQMDQQAASLLRQELEQRGIKFKMQARTKVLLDEGTGIGVRPNLHLAQQAGLYCERGIVVDDTLQSYDPCIYAVGECIQHSKRKFALTI